MAHRVGDELAREQEDGIGVALEAPGGQDRGDVVARRSDAQGRWLEVSPLLDASNLSALHHGSRHR